jgi:hypothetical protein
MRAAETHLPLHSNVEIRENNVVAIRTNAASLSKVESAELLKRLQATLPEAEYGQVKGYLVAACSEASEEEIDRAIQGISEEDEFVLMSYMMGTATHLAPLFQLPVIKQDYIIPDLLASFHVNKGNIDSSTHRTLKCFVDVKSTGKDKCKVGGSELRRLREFADHFGLPLLLAVRFTTFPRFPLWALVEDTDRTVTSITVRFEDIMNGKRETIWNDYWFSLRQEGVSFKATFTPEDGILSYNNYGNLQQFDILVDGLTLSCDDTFKATLRYIFFEQLAEEESITKEGTTTTQTLKPKKVLRSISDMLSRFNQLGRDDRAIPSSATKILLQAAQAGGKGIIGRDIIEALAQPLIKATLLKRFMQNNSATLSKVEHDGWEELVVDFFE